MKNINYVFGLLVLFLSGCGPKFQSDQLASLVKQVNEGAVCPNARSKIFTTYYQAYNTAGNLARDDFKTALHSEIQKNANAVHSNPMARARYEKSILAVHDILTQGVRETRLNQVQSKARANGQRFDALESEDDDQLHLARIEMRSQIEPQYKRLNELLDSAIAASYSAGKELGMNCSTEAPIIGDEKDKLALSSSLYGAHYTMATAYQSCKVLSLSPVTADVEPAKGVQKGEKVDAVGYGRVYTDLLLLNKTHYYHRGQSYGPGCIDQSNGPLVYDYGGKPVLTGKALNLFKNVGGGPALGIDCSAFISTATAVAGHLYNPSASESPHYRRFVARDFINPKISGWACYDSVTTAASVSIQSGDIAATNHHVVMVDQVGVDPFGLSKITSVDDCKTLSVAQFDFVVIQSSPEKGSIGINRFASKDYLTGSVSMANLFLGYGKAACLSKFDGQTRNPATSTYGLIRHKNNDACRAKRQPLVNERCVQSCSELREPMMSAL